MTEKDVIETFERDSAILKGHFLLTSGRHSDVYFEKFQVLQHPEDVQALCTELAGRFEGENVDLVIGPTTGGVLIAYEVAKVLGTRFIFAESEEGKRILKRGFSIGEGERTLIVDDVLTTGRSIREIIDIVEENKGEIVGIGCLVDRSGGKVNFGYRLEALLTVEAISYDPKECPLCREGIDVVKPGSRKL